MPMKASLTAVSFHAYHRQNVGKTVLVRALGDGLKQGASLGGSGLGAVQDPANGRSNSAVTPAPGMFSRRSSPTTCPFRRC